MRNPRKTANYAGFPGVFRFRVDRHSHLDKPRSQGWRHRVYPPGKRLVNPGVRFPAHGQAVDLVVELFALLQVREAGDTAGLPVELELDVPFG